jgi:1,4-dihydroxy-2-naphthoate polyprenyltransferase
MSTNASGFHPAEWFWLARPFSLTAATVPVLVGTALALEDAGFALGAFMAMLVGSLFIQAATNMFNEFYDEQRGLDTATSVGIAGSIVSGRVHARAVLLGAIACYTVALIMGLYLIWVGGWPILLLGCLSALGGYLYSAGPRPIAYTAASELVVFLFMGVLIVLLSYAVQTGDFPLRVALAATPVGALVAAILLANNVRDMDSDRRGGRKTLPIVFGRRGGILVYRGLVAGSYVLASILAAAGVVSPASLVVVLSLPLAARLWTGIGSSKVPQRLDPVVKRTAGLHLIFGLLYTVGILVGAAV